MVFSLTSTASHELFDRFLVPRESPRNPGDHSAVNVPRLIIPEVFLRLGGHESPHQTSAAVHVHDWGGLARSSSALTEPDAPDARLRIG
jgi:hypothetical protein